MAQPKRKCAQSILIALLATFLSNATAVASGSARTSDHYTFNQELFNGGGGLFQAGTNQVASSLDWLGTASAQSQSYTLISGGVGWFFNSPPIANAGPGQVVEATSPSGAQVALNGSASSDPDGDALTFAWSGPFGTASGPTPTVLLPLGSNLVTLTVTDTAGATVTATVSIKVQDTAPPVLNCPGGKMLEFQDETGTVATYSVTATDLCSAVTLAVTPPSGSLFPIGVTTVSAQATDGCGNSAECSFTVTVLGARGVKSNALAELIALRSSVTLTDEFAQKFDAAIAHLESSLTPTNWVDQTRLQPRGGNTAMNEEKLAASKLAEIMEAKACPVDPAVLQGLIDRIVKCDRLLAIISIQDAAAAGLNARKIVEDLAMVAKGDREAAAGHYANAIEHYRNAWRHALQLRVQVVLDPDGTTRVQFVANSSKAYLIEASTDLANWVPVRTCTADAEGNVEFTDAGIANRPVRFYRVVEQ